jgi:hypothetical protein
MAISGIAWGMDGVWQWRHFPGSDFSRQSFGLFLDRSTIGSAFSVSHTQSCGDRRFGNNLDAAAMIKPVLSMRRTALAPGTVSTALPDP